MKNAGEGVWTDADLPEGLVFGPYEGFYTKENTKKNSGYGWKVFLVLILKLFSILLTNLLK